MTVDVPVIVTVCSILHTMLPPWDFLNEFPASQRYYRLLVYIIGFVALNARSTVYQKISVNNPQGPNANVPAVVQGAVDNAEAVIVVPKPEQTKP
jgi:hypothetical protein